MIARQTTIMLFGALLAALVICGQAVASTGQMYMAMNGSSVLLRQEATIVVAAVSASGAAQVAQGRYGGEVLRVNRRGDVFRVKLRTSSGVIVVCVNANSGRIVGC